MSKPKTFKLYNKAGDVVNVGDKLKTSRGEVHVVESLHPPRHAASSGHIATDGGYYYPSVYGCKYVEVHSLPDELAKEVRAISKGIERKAPKRVMPADMLAAALKALVVRCDGAEGVQSDGSNMDTSAAHAALKKAGFEL
jgi:hypothetical protein